MSFTVTVRLVVESASPEDMPEIAHTGEKRHHTVVFRAEIPGPQSAGDRNPPFVLGHIRYEFGTAQQFVNGQVFESTLSFTETDGPNVKKRNG